MKKLSQMLAICLSVHLAACVPSIPVPKPLPDPVVSSPGVIKIATVSPLSGGQAGQGESIKLGAQLAIEEAQAKFKTLGFDLQIAPQDDQATPDVGVAVAKRLINDNDVLGVVGHLNSGVAIPSSEVYKEVNLVMVSPANTNPRVTDRNLPNVNRICGRDDIQGVVGAEYAFKTLRKARLFVIHDQTAYGQGLATVFRDHAVALGARVDSFVGTQEGSNFQPLINQMLAQNPDLVYYGGIYDKGAVLLNQMRLRSITATFMGGDGLDGADLVRIAGTHVLGTLFTSTAGPLSTLPKAANLVKTYKAKFGKDTESYGIYAYDAANVILSALENVIKANGGKKPTRDQVTAAVRKIRLSGLTGDIAFNSKGDRTLSDYYVVQMNKADYQTGREIVKMFRFAPPR